MNSSDHNITKNFEWSDTNRKLIIFIPNYGRGDYIINSIDQFKTNLPKEDYLIIIGNDGIPENFDSLYDKNVRYFTLNRKSLSSRNGCFIRNYFINRCEAPWIFQKDPETIIKPIDIKPNYDWIERYANIEPYSVSIIKPEFTVDYSKTGQCMTERMIPTNHYRFHWGCLFNNNLLQHIKGYDQEYILYGYEDTDLYLRLKNMEYCKIGIDSDLIAIHQWHPVDESVYADVNSMSRIFQGKDPKNIVRNPKGWGEG